MCVDICPTQVFDYDQGNEMAQSARDEDCIGCLSCFYVCPSQCIQVTDVHVQRPFYRLEGNVALVEKLLQEKTATSTLGPEDWTEAGADVASTLSALSTSIVEMMGRAHKALGRKAGTLSAAHLPEIYEQEGLEGVLNGLKQRFEHCFDFDMEMDGDELKLTFPACALADVVRADGKEVGEAITCQLFHEYFNGLLGAFTGKKFTCELLEVGDACKLRFEGS